MRCLRPVSHSWRSEAARPSRASLRARQPDAGARGDALVFDFEATRTVIAQQNKQFTDAHISGDVAAIDEVFLPDERSYPPGAPAVTLEGINAVRYYL
jgi:hypothetical protein